MAQPEAPAKQSNTYAAPQRPPPPHPALGVALDITIILLAGIMAMTLRDMELLAGFWSAVGGAPGIDMDQIRKDAVSVALFQALVIPLILHSMGQYRILRSPAARWSFMRVVSAISSAFAALIIMLFALGIPTVPRAALIMDFGLVVIATTGWRQAYQTTTRKRLHRGEGMRNVLLIGTDRLAHGVAHRIIADPLLGRRVVGFLTRPGSPSLLNPPETQPNIEILSPPSSLDVPDAASLLARHQPRHLWASISWKQDVDVDRALDGLNVEELMIAPGLTSTDLRSVLSLCQQRGINAHLIPDHHEELGIRPRPWNLGPFTLLDVHRRPISRLGWMAKRGMDILGAIVGLALFSPIIILTAIAVKIEVPREPVFFPGRRVGLKGRHFRMAKFTTMRPDAQEIEKGMTKENQREGPWFKLEADKDPRLTKVGRFIRKYSINEIPQFWNVLKGDMSLVGPRPPIPDEVARYVDFDFRYFRCLDVRPGLTGLWQVTAKNDPSFDRRIDLDLKYIHSWTIWLDIKILFMTLWAVVSEPEG